jgi:adenine-specific DNA-methyltransferase
VLKERRYFDAVIGNPQFVRYQNFPEEHRQIAFTMMQQAGLSPNRLTNAWLPFLVVGGLLLKETGRLAMVIPAELFQVNYAAEVRRFLSDYISRVTLITFQATGFCGYPTRSCAAPGRAQSRAPFRHSRHRTGWY